MIRTQEKMEAVIAFLSKYDPCSTGQICTAIRDTNGRTNYYLRRLRDAGKVKRLTRGLWCLVREEDKQR